MKKHSLSDQKGSAFIRAFLGGRMTSGRFQQPFPQRHGKAMEKGRYPVRSNWVFSLLFGCCFYWGLWPFFHSFPTPDAVEKTIENPLHRTGGAAPP